MVTQEQLNVLFETQLKPILSELEIKRKKIVVYYHIAMVFYAIMGMGFIVTIHNRNNPNLLWLIPAFAGAAIGLILSNKGYKLGQKNGYYASYKKHIVSKICQIIDPTWTYDEKNSVGETEYKASKLFPQEFNRFVGDDLVYGKIDKTDFRSSEMNTVNVKKIEDRKTTYPVFRGYFFHADFNKNFAAETYVDAVLGIQTCNAREMLFKEYTNNGLAILENPEFSRLFKVRTTDQVEARYILTPTIMEAIVKLYKNFKEPIHFSFVGSRVYCAIDFSKELFEAPTFKTCISIRQIGKHYNLFMLNTTIINELNLNTRIWTKK
jgi:hypothetical protein